MLFLLVSYAAAKTPTSAAEEISAIIHEEITSMPDWKNSDIRVEVTSEVKSLEPGESFRLAPKKELRITRRSVLAPIDVVRNGKSIRSLSVSAVVYVSTPAVVAARKIASGETITKEDVQESVIETTDMSIVLARGPEEIEGKIARRAFAAGDPLPLGAFSEPLLVRRGDTVSLRLERGGLALISSVRAEENGRLGEFIRVKNEDFSSVIRARVIGPAEVSIQ